MPSTAGKHDSENSDDPTARYISEFKRVDSTWDKPSLYCIELQKRFLPLWKYYHTLDLCTSLSTSHVREAHLK